LYLPTVSLKNRKELIKAFLIERRKMKEKKAAKREKKNEKDHKGLLDQKFN